MSSQHRNRLIVKQLRQVMEYRPIISSHSKRISNLTSRSFQNKQLESGEVSKTSSSKQKNPKEQLALLLIMVCLIIYAVFATKAVLTASNGQELLEVVKALLPFLITLLDPILHYYFGRK